MDADQLLSALESRGIEFGSSSSRDMSSASLKTLTDAPILERAVELFSTIMAEPQFPQEALERERARAECERDDVRVCSSEAIEVVDHLSCRWWGRGGCPRWW